MHLDRARRELDAATHAASLALADPAYVRQMFRTLEAFYEDDERRRVSGEADFGVHWLDGRNRRWRVSYVRNTGEIYAYCPLSAGDCVLLLGTFPPDNEDEGVTWRRRRVWYRSLDAALAGWADECGQPSSLNWIAQRVSSLSTPL